LPTKSPPPVPQAYSWTGFYIGPNVGFGVGTINYSSVNAAGVASSGSYAIGGPFGGGQVGVNHEFSNYVVIGTEADFEASGLGGSSIATLGGVTSSVSSQLTYFGTVRGRLGYAWNNLLLHGTGGWLYGQRRSTVTVGNGALAGLSATSSGSFTNGWTAGAGIEVAFMPNWSVKLEYLHLQSRRYVRLHAGRPSVAPRRPSPARPCAAA
jgi:outer membrane immunogenic protein